MGEITKELYRRDASMTDSFQEQFFDKELTILESEVKTASKQK